VEETEKHNWNEKTEKNGTWEFTKCDNFVWFDDFYFYLNIKNNTKRRKKEESNALR